MFIVEDQRFKTLEAAFDFALIFAVGAEEVLGCPVGILVYDENVYNKYQTGHKEVCLLMVFPTHTEKALFWEKYMEIKK